MKNYYAILDLDRTSSIEDIKLAFHRLARKYHPDLNKEPGAEENFKEVNEAYQVLSDSRARADYDAAMGWGRIMIIPDDIFSIFRREPVFSGIDLDFGSAGFGLGEYDDLVKKMQEEGKNTYEDDKVTITQYETREGNLVECEVTIQGKDRTFFKHYKTTRTASPSSKSPVPEPEKSPEEDSKPEKSKTLDDIVEEISKKWE